MKWLILSGYILFITSSCKESNDINYSFFVAGHVYGSPGTKEIGVYEPFKEHFEQLNTDNLSFGVFTGDFVKSSTEEQWIAFFDDVNDLAFDTHYALGNHEYKNEESVNEFISETYYSFENKKDLNIILNPNLDGWNISGDQLEFFKKQLKNLNKRQNLFIYFHQVLWKTKSGKFSNIHLNSSEGKADEINFWTEIVPLLEDLKNDVYIFAGDVGAGSWSSDCSYHSHKNITMMSSGMGKGNGDNYLMVKVQNNRKVIIKKVDIHENTLVNVKHGC